MLLLLCRIDNMRSPEFFLVKCDESLISIEISRFVDSKSHDIFERRVNVFNRYLKLVPGTGLEPVQEIIPADFKSAASTSSAIPA